MQSYKIVKGGVGPWIEGQIITDEDLAANPGLGGVKRLRDDLGVITEDFGVPEGTDGETVPPGKFVEVVAKPDASADPNGRRHGKRGKS